MAYNWLLSKDEVKMAAKFFFARLCVDIHEQVHKERG